MCDRWPSPPLFRRDTSASVQLHDSDRCARPAKRAGLECGQRAETATPHARRVRAGLVGLTHLLSCTPASGERLVAVPSHRVLELPHRPGGYSALHACCPRVAPLVGRCLCALPSQEVVAHLPRAIPVCARACVRVNASLSVHDRSNRAGADSVVQCSGAVLVLWSSGLRTRARRSFVQGCCLLRPRRLGYSRHSAFSAHSTTAGLCPLNLTRAS